MTASLRVEPVGSQPYTRETADSSTALERFSNIDGVFPTDPSRIPTGEVAYRGGPLLDQVEFVSIFWGPEWLLPPAPHGSYWKKEIPLVGYLTAFLDAVMRDGYLGLLRQYSVDKYQLGHAQHAGHFVFNDPVVSGPPTAAASRVPLVSAEQVAHQLERWVDQAQLPSPGESVAYLLLAEPGVACEDPTGRHRSPDIIGYHAATPSGIPFVLLTPDIQYVREPLRGRHLPEQMTRLESGRITRQISQALVDTITNPFPFDAPGWCSDRGTGVATASASDPAVSYQGYEVAPFWSADKLTDVPPAWLNC